MKALGALLISFAVIAAACSSDEPEVGLAGIVRTPSPDVGSVSLPAVTDGVNRDFTFTATDGGLLLVYFGYTSCPDVCPTTLADLRKAVRMLDEGQSDKIDVAFVTVDPERDNDRVVTSYIHAFFDDGVALRTGDPETLEEAADAFGAIFSVEEGESGEIIVEHSAFLYAVDDSGALLLSWPFGIEADLIAQDLRTLLKETST